MIGNELKKIRLEEGMTRADISQKSGVAASTIMNYELGRHPQLDALERLAEVLGYEIDLIRLEK
jgi:transcriptional regulator with XRE-family HTH domain|tara:strand:- start:429 stop:620 length:192 start_codon:yes stop_codon:yes gene_type:complete